MKLYFLGPKGTYTEQSAKKTIEYFKKISPELINDSNLIPISTITKVVDLVEKDNDSFGILPIENSIEGVVRPTIDSLYPSDCKIRAHLEIEIKHCIAGYGTKEKIKHIISHPQALIQTQKYVLQNFDDKINLISADSTAQALNLLKEKDETYAAIGSCTLAQELGLNIFDENIGDIKDNKTRFILISKKELNFDKTKFPKTRTSIIFNTENKPGALFKILEIFKNHNSNLIYLESRPSRNAFGEYYFCADIDKSDDEIAPALEEVQKHCRFYKMLGSYFSFE